MRFNLRQLLMGVAFVAFATAYAAQSVRYRNLATKYDHLEERYAKAREMVKQVVDIEVEDQETGPEGYEVYLRIPEGWPAGIKDNIKDVSPGQMPEVLISGMKRVTP